MAHRRSGNSEGVPDERASSGRFTTDPQRRERLIQQVMRARRSVEADMRGVSTAAGDPAKIVLVERAKQWAGGDSPGGPLPGPAS